jgi:hypothetical protein
MVITCVSCGSSFDAKNARAKYCSERCRKRVQRGGKVLELRADDGPARPSPPDGERLGPVATATHAALTEAERLATPLGAAALALAARLDQPGTDTGSAVAALARQLEATLESATRGAGSASAPDQLRDELAARRAKHA